MRIWASSLERLMTLAWIEDFAQNKQYNQQLRELKLINFLKSKIKLDAVARACIRNKAF